MKLLKVMATVAVGGVLAFSLAGCQKNTSQDESQGESPQATDAVQDVDDEPFYVLIVGNDSRKGTAAISDPYYADGLGRSDTMMLARIDPTTYRVTLVSVPRDTACTIDGETYKINEAYHRGGIEAAIEQVERLTGVSIKYYFDTGFVQFENMVNGWGGLAANVPFDFVLSDGVTGEDVHVAAGEQQLDGKGALAFARMRKEYPEDQEAVRQVQDRQLVERAIRRVAQDPARVAADVATLLENTDTNWPKDKLLQTIGSFVDNADSLSFYSGTGPYAGDIDDSAGGQWLVTRDEGTWKRVVEAVDAGADPTTVVPLPACL